ncbi:MAG TPA: hypothetical protein VH855_04230 [Acetobacteraceae bacterium]|jgi:hypothetical protein
MSTHLLCVGGKDHYLRSPFLRAATTHGFRDSAAGTGDATPFQRHSSKAVSLVAGSSLNGSSILARLRLQRVRDCGPLRDWPEDSPDRSACKLRACSTPHGVQTYRAQHLSGHRNRARELWAILMVHGPSIHVLP